MSAALAVPLRAAFSPEALQAGFAVLWWAHIVLVAAFLVYLPFSKHLHIATSFPNIWYRKLAPPRRAAQMDLEDETATFGLKTLQDLGWKDLLDGFTCTECGRCEQACPAHATGKPLDPKLFIMGIRDMAVDAEHGIDLIPNSPIVRETYGLDDTQPDAAALARPIVDTAIPYDAVWDCVTCGACVQACPVLIEHVDKIVGLRRNLVLEESRFPQELTPAFRAMEGQGNPWGQPAAARLDWTKPLPFEVRTVAARQAAGALDELEVLYWVGCAAAFDPRNQKVARAVATCLHAAGVSFAVLGQEESCTGDPARRMGNDYVFQILASGAVDTLQRYGMGERTIVTACPHCFNTIANEYGQLGGAFRVVHHSTYLASLVSSGRLATLPEDATSETGDHRPGAVTVHDSCYLARYNGVVPPRATCSGPPASRSPRWSAAARRRSVAAPAGAGCGWRRRAARASTPSAPARSSRPARRPWPRPARSAWSCSRTGWPPRTAGRRSAPWTSARCSPPASPPCPRTGGSRSSDGSSSPDDGRHGRMTMVSYSLTTEHPRVRHAAPRSTRCCPSPSRPDAARSFVGRRSPSSPSSSSPAGVARPPRSRPAARRPARPMWRRRSRRPGSVPS